MNHIYVTGDTHRDFTRFYTWARRGIIEKGDYLIVAGDFGINWYGKETDQKMVDKLRELPFTILFIDGNHENFDSLNNDYPIEKWNGGNVHRLSHNVLHLMRGELFTILEHTFFTFGGGSSVDKTHRQLYESLTGNKTWWEEELPNENELKNGLKSLESVNYKVDYVITHTCSYDTLRSVFQYHALVHYAEETDILNLYFEELEQKLTYTWWYFGHLHLQFKDEVKRQTLLFENLEMIV